MTDKDTQFGLVRTQKGYLRRETVRPRELDIPHEKDGTIVLAAGVAISGVGALLIILAGLVFG